MINETAPARADETLPANIQAVRDAIVAINKAAADESDAIFLFDDALADAPHVHFAFLASQVRQHVPADGGRLTLAQKTFWISFAEAIGPDFLDGLKLAVNFANEADNY